MNHPTDAYDKFEEISALVKQTKLKFNDPDLDSVVNAAIKVPREVEITEKHLAMRKDLLNGVSKFSLLILFLQANNNISKEDKALLTNKKFCIPNFEEEAEMLAWAGIDFGKMDNYQI
jgi:hypothetical protein